MSKTVILVIFGGRSFEHRVSLDSAKAILNWLDTNKYDVLTIGVMKSWQCISWPKALSLLLEESTEYTGPQDIDVLNESANTCKNIVDCLEMLETRPDIIFPVIHGANGEDWRLQGMLDLMGIPYVGSGVAGSAICMDKIITKAVLEKVGISQLPYFGFNLSEWHKSSERVIHEIGLLWYPIFIKPANLWSSIGITKVLSREKLEMAIENAFLYDSHILAEKGLDSPREIEFSVLGNQDLIVSIAGENIISSRHDFYTYEAKYIDENASYIEVPAKHIPEELLQNLQKDAKEAYLAVRARWLARIDFFVDRETSQYYLNEINTMPEFTEMSMYPVLLEFSGIYFSDLLDRLIDLAYKK